jgi:ABC-type iron transport system FetAB permease component
MTEAHHDNHGQTPAAWTAVIIMIVASLICAVAAVFGNVAWFIGGLVVALIGLIVGKAMAMAGLGKQPVDQA